MPALSSGRPARAARGLAARGLLCGLLCLLAACARRGTEVEQGNRTGVLHCSIGSEPTDLDPHVVTSLAEARVLPALFEPLVGFDPQTLRPVPGLAERWETSPDGLVYTFHLRAAKWSNGEPVTAQDCVDSWRRVVTPELAADYAYLFYIIRGAEAFHKGATTDFGTVGLAAPDARTLVVTLAHPAPYFLQILLNAPWRPINVRSIERIGPADRRGTPWTRPEFIVTDGPFRLKEWTPHQRIVVEKSPDYWDRDQVALNAIHFYPIDSVDAEERGFRGGQLHVTYNVSLSKLDTYRAMQPPRLRVDDYVDTFFFRFNTRKAPLDDPRFRRALSLAIDRPVIATRILRGGQTPATSFTPPAMPGYVPPVRPAHDLAEARRQLAAAGYGPGGKPVPPLELLYNNSEVIRLVAEAIQEMWRRDLGVEVHLVNQENKVVFANRRIGNYQILLSEWVADYLDATTFLDLWRSDAGNNHTGWGSDDYDALMHQADATADPRTRAALLARAEGVMLDEAPIAPVYFNTHVYLLNPAVKGWRPSPMDHIDYRHVRLEP